MNSFKHINIKIKRDIFVSVLFTCVKPEPKLLCIASNWALYNKAFRSAPVN